MNNLKQINQYMLDMDGTIYLEDQLIDGAPEFLEHLSITNKKYIFLTNNSSKSPKDYKQKLSNLGIDVDLSQIYTSGNATIEYLKLHHPNKKIYLLGNENLKQQFKEDHITLWRDDETIIASETIVVLGFDTTLTFDKLNIACTLINEGSLFLCTHPDLVCPLKNGKSMIDAGSIAKAITAATNVEPLILGKPSHYMIEGAINRYGFNKETLAIVGDRLYTDIKMGNQGGITSILVLSGEAKEEDITSDSPTPTYIMKDVKELLAHISK